MKKAIIKILAMGALLVMSSGLFLGCVNKESPQERIKRISGINIPADAHLVYNYIGDTYTGRAPQYTIFKFEKDPTDFFTSKFSYGGELVTKENGVDVYSPVVEGFLHFTNEKINETLKSEIEQRLERYKITSDFKPNWDNSYSYYIERNTHLFYFTDVKTLIFENQGH